MSSRWIQPFYGLLWAWPAPGMQYYNTSPEWVCILSASLALQVSSVFLPGTAYTPQKA